MEKQVKAHLNHMGECVMIRDVVVYANESGEIFIQTPKGRALRISPQYNGDLRMYCDVVSPISGGFDILLRK